MFGFGWLKKILHRHSQPTPTPSPKAREVRVKLVYEVDEQSRQNLDAFHKLRAEAIAANVPNLQKMLTPTLWQAFLSWSHIPATQNLLAVLEQILANQMAYQAALLAAIQQTGTTNVNLQPVLDGLASVLQAVQGVKTGEDKIMATLADVQAAVAQEQTVEQSAITLLQQLASQVAALQPNQAAIDQLAAQINANASSLAAAVAANTPAAPPASS